MKMMEAIDASCPDEATILELVQGRLGPSVMRAAESHIAGCAECRVLVSTLARSSLVGTAPSGASRASDPGKTAPLPPSVRFPSRPPSLPPPPPVREGDIVAGKYKVERVLGAGGMGIVVAATHVHLGQRVALKFLLPAACREPGAVARFLREGRAAVRIQSEHVARVTDVGILDGSPRDGQDGSARDAVPYMIMEFLHGTDLAEVLRARGPLPVADAIDFVLQACEAVAEAHALGIVHRDLKPANLFLTTRADGSSLVKVLDFGISKTSHKGTLASHTAGELVMGSPRYMSPEQMRSTRDVDARTDVWALGVVLHELVSGLPVFDADTMIGLSALVATGAPVPLRAVRPDVPEALERAVLRCLEKEPNHRMPSVAALAEALAPIAPPSAQVSIERIVRVLGGLGSARTELDLRPHVPSTPPGTVRPAVFAPIGMATGGGFGRTTESGSRGRGRGFGFTAGAFAALFVVAGIAAAVFVTTPRRAPATASIGEARRASRVAEAPSTPAPPPLVVAPPEPAPLPIVVPAQARLKPAAPHKSEAPASAPAGATLLPIAPPIARELETADVNRKGLLDRK